MKPYELHTKAMDYSFQAKSAREKGNENDALKLYEEAAHLESQAADFYIERIDLEPTRSILIRSAAFLNLKAGLPENAEKYIFLGIINTEDKYIKEQLYEALELCLSQRKLDQTDIFRNVHYINTLRQKSQYYSIEPLNDLNGGHVSLDVLSEFSNNYIKSFFAYSRQRYKESYLEIYPNEYERVEKSSFHFQEKVKPLITSSSFGSFKFSIATDFVDYQNENKIVNKLKSNILFDYHNDIFIKELTDENIDSFKKRYTEDEITAIFKPLFNIKSNKSNYNVLYYDKEDLRKHTIKKENISQRKKLLPTKAVNEEEIGVLVSELIHSKSSKKNVVYKQVLTTASFDLTTKSIKPKNLPEILLNEEILIHIDFDAASGFTFSFDELNIESKSNDYFEGLNSLYILFLERIRMLFDSTNLPTFFKGEERDLIQRLINDPSSLK
jgi:hypothetical protein